MDLLQVRGSPIHVRQTAAAEEEQFSSNEKALPDFWRSKLAVAVPQHLPDLRAMTWPIVSTTIGPLLFCSTYRHDDPAFTGKIKATKGFMAIY